MGSFEDLCKIVETTDPKTFDYIIAETSARILAELSMRTEDRISAVNIYMDFLLCAVAADGRLDENEFLLVKPIMELITGEDVDFEYAKEVFSELGLEDPERYKDTMDRVVDLLGCISPGLKDDIILVCMMICSVDGEICEKERTWIRQLMD